MTRKQLASLIVRDRLSELEAGVRILWLLQRVEKLEGITAGEIANFFSEQSLSEPNRSRLKVKLISDRRILHDRRSGALRLRATALPELDMELSSQDSEERPTTPFVVLLEAHAMKLKDTQTKSFVREAIQCVRNNTPRAAIIMAWCGAISTMQEYIFKHHLGEFNMDAVKNGLLKSPAKTIADVRDISKESQFIECLARISLIDDSTKRALKRCLDRRNDVGHPSEVKFSDAAVADHIETLMLNVFDRFSRI